MARLLDFNKKKQNVASKNLPTSLVESNLKMQRTFKIYLIDLKTKPLILLNVFYMGAG